MKYKAIKIVHTELSIADNLINKFTGKKRHFFFLFRPLGFFTCTEMSCGSCCSRSSRDNRDVLSRFKTWLCTRYEGQVQPLYFSRNPNPTLGREISAHRPWSLSNCQARLLFLYRLRNMQENFLRGTRCLAHSWTQIPATQMQSHIIKRPLSPGELVVGGDAHTHTLCRCKPPRSRAVHRL